MSSARAQANHKLYLAKIQLSAWRQALAARDVAASTLTEAFLPALRAHLRDAYGWFLLAVSGSGQLPENPPQCCRDLPAVAAGQSLPGEIREFQQLESNGWLADMLAQADPQTTSGRSEGNLAASAAALPGPDQAGLWIERLAATFDRMGDSLDEY